MKAILWSVAFPFLMLLAVGCGPSATDPVASMDAGYIDAPPNVESPDDDGDGYTVLMGDCNDNDPNVHPGKSETCGDNIDNDCNGETDAEQWECMTPCDAARAQNSYLGCEFYAVDLPQIKLDKKFGIIVANPSATAAAAARRRRSRAESA